MGFGEGGILRQDGVMATVVPSQIESNLAAV